jgi:cytochrome c oxidase assembly factor CtaG
VHVLTHNWSFDPFLVVTFVVAGWHELGVRHLAGRSRPARNAARRRQSLLLYAGLAVLDLSVVSPIDFYSNRYFWVHTVQHLLLMYAVPVLIVAGAPWLPLAHGLPVGLRRRVGRAVLLSRWAAPLRLAAHAATSPWVSVAAFNLVMILWHLPGPFDLAFRNQAVHIWLMHGSFFVVGVLFWMQFIGSYPFRPRLGPLEQVGALIGTNVVMFVLAFAMGMLATSSWYPVYDHLHGVSLSALGDQHLGAGILWVCGDFWCFPAVYRAVRRFIDDDERRSLDDALDRVLRGA